MAAGDDGFNGSTIAIGEAGQTPLRGISYEEAGAEVKVSGSADGKALFVAGQAVETITYDIVGSTTLAIGDAAAAVTITWNDTSTDTFTTGVLVAKSISGSEDSEIITSLTFKRAS